MGRARASARIASESPYRPYRARSVAQTTVGPFWLACLAVWAFGTIDAMKDHRIRLTDEDIELILAALRARLAMTRGKRSQRTQRLIARLGEGVRGNPDWILGLVKFAVEQEGPGG